MSAARETPRAVHCVGIALASGLGPMLVLAVYLAFVTGEAFWLLPTMLLGVPGSALVGLVASVLVYRAEATRLSTVRTWLLAAGGAAVPCLLLVLLQLGAVTPWVATPLVCGALLGAAPPALLARVRAERARGGGP